MTSNQHKMANTTKGSGTWVATNHKNIPQHKLFDFPQNNTKNQLSVETHNPNKRLTA